MERSINPGVLEHSDGAADFVEVPAAEGPNRTGRDMAIGFGLGILIILMLLDMAENQSYRFRDSDCVGNLGRMGDALAIFRAKHRGKMPAGLQDLQPYLPGTEAMPAYTNTYCRLTSLEKAGRWSYSCRFPRVKDEPICWDRRPQIPQHTVWFWLNRPNRNVLFADGSVRSLSEDEFQRLRVSGESYTLP